MIAHGCTLPDGTRQGIAALDIHRQARRISSQSPGPLTRPPNLPAAAVERL